MCRLKASWLFIILGMYIVRVRSQNNGDIQLVGGACQMQGRLEVYYSGQWGTVCDDGFGYPDAMVVCRQLGASSTSNVQFYTSGDGVGRIWLSNLACNGKERNITSCTHSAWGAFGCSNDEDVGVQCFNAFEGDLRLVGGEDFGRLEIFHSNLWGSICDDNFDTNDAKVACRQLNLPTSRAKEYTHKNGTGPIWLDNKACNGNETGIDMCSHGGWGVHDCGHSEDVGIRCHGTLQPQQGDLRLADGVGPRDGRLEVYYQGEWGTICDDNFGAADARVACRQLTYSTMEAASYKPREGGSQQHINLDGLGCTGNEVRLTKCSHAGLRNDDCSHSEDVGIQCYGNYVVNGNWGQWSVWDICSVTCNSGTQRRKRYCNSPIPSATGSSCIGNSTETQTCQIRECPEDSERTQKHVTDALLAIVGVSCCLGTVILVLILVFIAKRIRQRKRNHQTGTCSNVEQRSLPNAYIGSDDAMSGYPLEGHYELLHQPTTQGAVHNNYEDDHNACANAQPAYRTANELYVNLKLE